MRSRAASFELAPADPSSADAQYCLGHYFDELAARFRGGFDRNRDAAADVTDLALPEGYLLIARLSGRAVGCAGLRALAPGVGELKRMWVAPAARGMGIGRSFLRELEAEARRRGLRALRLDTNESLSEALQLYRSCGYREIARFNDNPYAHYWFEKVLA
ncbi:MAG TPA: GNAT family N-acetyltransferase [Steroidobacteraceae bacterium]|nr:GNAT family N-acetyltransferase [Steroidobacteraceae bacterium]